MRKKGMLLLMTIIILIISIYLLSQSGTRVVDGLQMGLQRSLEEMAGEAFLPGIQYALVKKDETTWMEKQLMAFFPISEYLEKESEKEIEIEDNLTYEMILTMQAEDEERMSEDLEETPKESVDTASVSAEISMDKLKDFDYLISKFYTVDSTTMVYEEELKLILCCSHAKINRNGCFSWF